MIFLDGIIYDLQRSGGISVYFNEIVQGCAERPDANAKLILGLGRNYNHDPQVPVMVQQPRPLERLRQVQLPSTNGATVFMSSYYRRPRSLVPTVVTVHDFIHRRFGRGLRNRAFVWQQAAAIQSASWIICVSESTRRDLLHFFPQLDPARISVILNGVSEEYHTLPGVCRENCMLIVGSRSAYKNFRQAVYTMLHLPEYRLEIVGGGPITREEHAMLETNCPGRYQIHGQLGSNELNLLYNRCRALLYLSDYEGFGIPPLEAMRTGCVPIVKRNSSIPEVVGSAGQFVGGSPEEIAERVRTLSDQDVYAQAAAEGYRQATHFSWPETRRRTVELLLHVANDQALKKIGPISGIVA